MGGGLLSAVKEQPLSWAIAQHGSGTRAHEISAQGEEQPSSSKKHPTMEHMVGMKLSNGRWRQIKPLPREQFMPLTLSSPLSSSKHFVHKAGGISSPL